MKYFHSLRDMSVRKKIILIFITFGFIPLIILEGYVVSFLTNKLTEYELKTIGQTIDLVSNSIDQVLETYDKQSTGFYYQEDMLNYLILGKNRPLDRKEMYLLNGSVSKFMRGNPYIRSVYIFTESNQVAYWDDNYTIYLEKVRRDPESLYPFAKQNGMAFCQSTFYYSRYNSTAKNFAFSFGRVIKNTKNVFEKIGILVINLDINCIADICNKASISPNGTLMIVDSENNIVWHNNNELITRNTRDIRSYINLSLNHKRVSEVIVNNENCYILSNRIAYSDWTCIAIVPKSDMAIQAKFMQKSIIIMGLLLFISLMSIGFTIDKNLLVPIRQMAVIINETKFTTMKLKKRVYSKNEIGMLYSSFDDMKQRISQLLNDIEYEHLKNKTQEIEVLRAQINPHFLYNTLDTINWMARDIKAIEISQMLTSLSSILRYSIKDFSYDVMLSDEVKWLENYIFIQKKRFENQFEVYFNIDESLLNRCVKKLIMQPIVENAILHGLKDVEENGRIDISIKAYDEDIKIEIFDNGCGMSEEQIIQTLNGLGGGVGIYNTNQLIKYSYGENYGISIFSQMNHGTRVIILIPQIEGDVAI